MGDRFMDTVEYRADFGSDVGKARILRAITAYWCGNHCTEEWDVEDDGGEVRLLIAPKDIVVFSLSDPGDIFQRFAAG